MTRACQRIRRRCRSTPVRPALTEPSGKANCSGCQTRRMHRPARRRLASGLLVFALAACGAGEAAVTVSEVWARSTPVMQDAGVVYMTITGGSEKAVLVGVSVPADVAGSAMLHQTNMNSDAVMSMSPVAEIEVPAGAPVSLEPGGYHIMLMDLVEPLVAGNTFDVDLMFADGSQMTVQAQVKDE